MTPARLLWRNLLYHWRGNLALLLGVVVGTAVLTGALLVGDSQRGSLRELALRRLGWIDEALVAPRFFREELASELKDAADHVCPALVFQGTVSTTAEKEPRSVRKVTVFGVDDRFLPGVDEPWLPPAGDTTEAVYLNAALAEALGVEDGAQVALHLQKQHNVPRETLLGKRDDQSNRERVVLTARVLEPDEPGSQFTVNPGPESPRNAFVPLAVLQDRMTARRGEEGDDLRGRVNALFFKSPHGDIQQTFSSKLILADWDLSLRKMDRSKEWSLESRKLILESAVTDAVRRAKLSAAPTFVNMADTVALTGDDGKPVEIPYSVVAAVALDEPNGAALEIALRAKVPNLGSDDIILANWKARPIQAKVGTPVRVKYYRPDDGGRLELKEKTFRLAAILPLEGPLDDRGLVPQVRGITDRPPLSWEPPFPYDRERMRKAGGNDYWTEHKTAPRGYIALKTGEELWHSRFGTRTSFRLSGEREKIESALLDKLDPKAGGLVVEAVKANALKGSGGGFNFALLFLGFSFFLILSALLLVGLLFRLSLDRRSQEVGVLLASGLRRRTIRRLLLIEGGVVALVGALIGTGAAIVYCEVLLGRLRAWWPGGLDASALRLHVTPLSLLIGFAGALLVSVLTILWAVRAISRVAPRALIQGQTTDEPGPVVGGRPRRSLWIASIALVGAIACVVAGPFVRDHEAQAGTFFGSGMLLLTAGIAGMSAWMRGSRRLPIGGHGKAAVARLGVRNAARHPSRSLLTAGLLAAAAFLLVGVESFRREPGKDFLRKEGGSGGFALLAESDLPLFRDLNTEAGRGELLDRLATRLPKDEYAEAEKLLKEITVIAFRVRAGDDASCLNLYQPRRPRILGVPDALIDEGGFAFAATTEKRDNPWRLLDEDARGVPVFGEKNTVEWMLNSGLDRTIPVPDAQGTEHDLRIVGLLHDSVFQNSLLMSETRFLELYPDEQGYRFFLIRVDPDQIELTSKLLKTALWDRGFEVTPARERLEAYLEVEKMYLSTFQKLGGMGLLLGTLGLAVVLLRSVWERRGELALLRALGYRRGTIGWLVLAENGFLLLLGLGLGTVAALASVAPHLLASGGQVGWLGLFAMLGVSLLAGLVASVIATAATVRAALLPALRRE